MKVCTDWCTIANWSTYPWNYNRWNQCISSKAELQAKVNTLVLNPYSAQARQDFLDCTGLALPTPDFGLQWDSGLDDLQTTIANAECALRRYGQELSLLESQAS